MIDLQAFVKSMKMSWLRRLFTTKMAWQEVIRNQLPDIQEILVYGSKKILKISASIKNPCWKNVLEAFADFSSAHKPEMPQLLSESMWFSDHTKYKCSIITDWNKKGIRFLTDLFDSDSGRMHSKTSLKDAYDIKVTFLCFSSLMKSLPDDMKSLVIEKEYGPIMPHRMNLVFNDTNISRLAYNVYVENKRSSIAQSNTKQKEKWLRDIGCFEDDSFAEVVAATKTTCVECSNTNLLIDS